MGMAVLSEYFLLHVQNLKKSPLWVRQRVGPTQYAMIAHCCMRLCSERLIVGVSRHVIDSSLLITVARGRR